MKKTFTLAGIAALPKQVRGSHFCLLKGVEDLCPCSWKEQNSMMVQLDFNTLKIMRARCS